MTETPTPTALNRIVFWTAYALGSLVLLFSFLLAQVPRGRNTDYTLDYFCWSLAAILLLTSLLAARHTWKFWNPFAWRGASSIVQLFVGAAWVELAFSIYGILSFATSR